MTLKIRWDFDHQVDSRQPWSRPVLRQRWEPVRPAAASVQPA